ncbi:MAG: sigma 54-interacting transcriptional regulator [Candidatus Schekmanbacteria bacterium]|nr:sigma 54-interacting transcriptional regulator [Candidatus Schekmanbacteria bacterium]
MDPFALPPVLDHAQMWKAIEGVVDRVYEARDVDTVLTDCLDTIIEILGADRGLVLRLTSDGTPYPIQARKWGHRLKPHEQAQISNTTLQRVLDTGDYIFDISDMGGADSFATYGITGVLAGPMRAITWRDPAPDAADRERLKREIRGVVYLDFRSAQQILGDLHLALFQTATKLMAWALDHHETMHLSRRIQAAESFSESNLLDDQNLPSLDDLLGPSTLAGIRKQLIPVLSRDTPILILGESGTGKTLFARAIAAASHRRLPFVRANLGRLDDRNTVISELFGHVKGSYTGAVTDRVGKVERASGGTLFLDEVLNLPLDVQPLLLDFLQDGTYEPLGWNGPAPKQVVTRVIAATNGDIDAAVRRSEFRLDVYYRLAGTVVRLPPLRDRRADIPMLAEQYLRRTDGKRRWELAPSLRDYLLSAKLAWDGNIRELQHLLDKTVANALSADSSATKLSRDHVPTAHEVRPEPAVPALASDGPLCQAFAVDEANLAETYHRLEAERSLLDEHERHMIELALSRHDGVVLWAAEALDMPRSRFRSRLQTLGIDRLNRRRRHPGERDD